MLRIKSPTHMRELGRRKLKRTLCSALKYGALVSGFIVLVGCCFILLFPNLLINNFAKPRAVAAFAEAFPGHALQIGEIQFDIWENLIECDLVTVNALDTSFECSVHAARLGGIDWTGLLWGSDSESEIFSDAHMETGAAVLTFHKAKQELRLDRLHISVPSHELLARSVSYDQLLTDTQYFASSPFRQTRYRLEIPLLHLLGMDIIAAIQGTGYRARSLAMHDVSADILVNMDKPYNAKSTRPLMPNNALASIKQSIALDSMNVIHGRFKYSEQFTHGGTPGVISVTDVVASVLRINNQMTKPDTLIVHASGVFMHAGTVKVFMEIPLKEGGLSMRYSGTLGRMNLDVLNAFLEPGEHRRITSGTLQNASFAVTVRSGRAVGSVSPAYSNLRISVLDEHTGSDSGFMNQVYSFIGKVFVIRGTNLPDEQGKIKIGSIRYKKRAHDTFFQLVWFALRGGLGEVVGF